MRIKDRFDECKSCVNRSPGRISETCLSCTSGEFFEELIADDEPSENDLFSMIGDEDE